jgi:nickel/cobalt transporter (NiCoT) family protein
MENVTLDFNGMLLMLILGLRHGLDPDHIAVIDGMTLRHFRERPSLARWAGTLFALGHGAVVTVIAVLVAVLSRSIELPAQVSSVAEWVPVVLLLLVGTINVVALLRNGQHTHAIKGWRYYFLPKRLRETSHPLGIFAIGVLFALVFDTTTQAAAWGLAAAGSHGVSGALLIGILFSAGMVATDTLDSRLLTNLLQRTDGTAAMYRYRRFLGWLIVAMAYGVAGYSILAHFQPAFEIGETAYTGIGLGFFAVVLSIYALLWYRGIHLVNQKNTST